MQLHIINAGLFKLDGGAMFGVVPKKLWQKHVPADADNLCTWAMRCLLVEMNQKLVLIDTGMGNKQDAKFFGHYQPQSDHSLVEAIAKAGFGAHEITDVLLTHLHFDHCGGAVTRNGDKLTLTFPNATVHVGKEQWHWATPAPNAREKASFLPENILPIQQSGQLNLLDKTQMGLEGFDFAHVYGHTEGMLLPILHYKGRKVIFMADLIPAAAHVPLAWVMGYDMRPLQTLTEKEQILKQAATENWVLFFEHDAQHQCATVKQTEKGIVVAETFPLSAL